jgi:23S rRNA (guanosine2251-2'-O)-methyltransferase
VVATDRHAPPEGGALAKAASGALETVPVVRVTNLARALETLADIGYWRTGLAAEGPEPLAARPDRSAVALVLGAEGAGLRRLTAEHCDSLERISGAGGLNVSVAAAVALYELSRVTN